MSMTCGGCAFWAQVKTYPIDISNDTTVIINISRGFCLRNILNMSPVGKNDLLSIAKVRKSLTFPKAGDYCDDWLDVIKVMEIAENWK